MLLFRPETSVPADAQGKPIDSPHERVKHLIETLEKARIKVIIPTPVLAEILVRTTPTEAEWYIREIGKYSVFRIESFDTRAAIEVAVMTRNAIDRPRRRDPSATTWAKLKYDRQIVAVAKVAQATHIYSDDRDIRAIANREGIQVRVGRP
ncbi:MAG: hypothetical protein ACREDV_11390 [Methylocella sp.]